MDIAAILISQYQASLEMLRQTIINCPESLWNAANDKNKFWHVAYHALFFTHEYLADSEEEALTPWIKHRDGYEDFEPSQSDAPYDRDTILEYLTFCQQQVAEKLPRLNLEEGFDEIYTPLELQIYSIRHIMQHTGELMERLSVHTDVQIDWVGSNHG